MIAVPANFDRIYADHERRLALDHELAHHRSGDLVANLFAFVLLCLQWFNPIAWVAHAAFRFDQEAACDARVLDKVDADDRADYGRAIAKAASGRALLFASALDRRNTLHRRLKSMLANPTSGRRLAGRLTVVTAVAIALPLTATRAIEYVDTVVPRSRQSLPQQWPRRRSRLHRPPPRRCRSPARSPQQSPPRRSMPTSGMVMINGKTKRWNELTPDEKAEIRESIAEARRELAEHRIDRAELQREIQETLDEAQLDKQDLQRDLAEARADIARAMVEIDAHSAEIRRAGSKPGADQGVDPGIAEGHREYRCRSDQAQRAGVDRSCPDRSQRRGRRSSGPRGRG